MRESDHLKIFLFFFFSTLGITNRKKGAFLVFSEEYNIFAHYPGIPSLARNIPQFYPDLPIVRARLFSAAETRVDARLVACKNTVCIRVRFADRFASSEHKISITSMYYISCPSEKLQSCAGLYGVVRT